MPLAPTVAPTRPGRSLVALAPSGHAPAVHRGCDSPTVRRGVHAVRRRPMRLDDAAGLVDDGRVRVLGVRPHSEGDSIRVVVRACEIDPIGVPTGRDASPVPGGRRAASPERAHQHARCAGAAGLDDAGVPVLGHRRRLPARTGGHAVRPAYGALVVKAVPRRRDRPAVARHGDLVGASVSRVSLNSRPRPLRTW